MRYIALLLVFPAAACSPRPAAAPADGGGGAAPVTLADCVKAVQAVHAGTMVKVEGKSEGGKQILEFDVRSADGTQWDVECDPATAQITETEEEVNSPDDARFKAKMKVSSDDAKKTALAAHPGEVVELEYELESNGDASYEIDIRPTGGGEEFKVEVDAATGKIVEDEVEHFQIGIE